MKNRDIPLTFDQGDFRESCGCGHCDYTEDCDDPVFHAEETALPLARRLYSLRSLTGAERAALEGMDIGSKCDPHRLREILQNHIGELA